MIYILYGYLGDEKIEILRGSIYQIDNVTQRYDNKEHMLSSLGYNTYYELKLIRKVVENGVYVDRNAAIFFKNDRNNCINYLYERSREKELYYDDYRQYLDGLDNNMIRKLVLIDKKNEKNLRK